ncbi:MAG TPA: IclR family transcriptional regulator C-terminal domain-containing protein [Alphaproteobacteria bacterium]|nr:IclR family transcriptional regulator C-terminal domain-containing protein [Alphaproteobacteria bacterium]
MDRSFRQSPKTLERYATILETIAPIEGGLSLTEIARSTGLPKGSVHRILGALVDAGFAASGRGRTTYSLGPRLLRLLHLGAQKEAIEPIVRPLLYSLSQQFGQTAFMAKLIGREVHSVVMTAPDETRQSFVQPGRVMAPNAAASAKAIIAFQPESFIDAVLEQPLPRFTANTCVDPARLRDGYAQVRRDGYALCLDEMDPGVMTVAVPVHLEGIGVIYSIGVVGLQPLLSRFPIERLVAALRGVAVRAAEVLRIGLREAQDAGRPALERR